MKFKTLIIFGIMLFIMTTHINNIFAATIDITADVIGIAIDEEYDGVFETLYDRSLISEFNDFTIGRVVEGSFISERRSILEFDLSSINSGATIDNATLILDWVSASTTLGTTNFYGFTGSGNLDISNATNTGSIVASSTAQFLDHDVSVDVTSFIQGLVNDSNIWAGFVGVETVDGANVNYRAEPDYYIDWDALYCADIPMYCGFEPELFQPNPRLLINISTVPLPPAIWLFSSGLLILIGITKRNKPLQ